ncbi:MAG: magnesium transporter [Candidatus Heimdallarchaeota archaeon]
MSSSSSLGKKTAVNLFFGMFIQAIIALAFDSGGIVSGIIASSMMDIQRIKWIVLIYAPLLAARGDIAILAGKLGTGLHLGTVKPAFRNNTPMYRSLVSSTLTIAIFDAFLIGIATYVMNLLTFPEGIRVLNPTIFFVIPILVLAVATILSVQLTSAVSFFTYKKGLNPDIYVVPVTNTINNILITLIYAGVLAILKPWSGNLVTIDGSEVFAVASNNDLLGTYIAIIPAVLAVGAIIYVIMKNRKEREYRKIMKEAIFAVFASAIIGTITGVTLSKGEAALEKYPQLLVAFPALISTLVDQNAITANILITDFSAGYTEPSVKSIRKPKVWTMFAGIAAGGIVITMFLSIIGTFIKWGSIAEGTRWTVILVMIVTVLANAIGYVLVGSLIFVLAIFAFKREIDPDNFAIPLTACLSDLACAGMIIAFSFLMLPGVGGESTAEMLSMAATIFLG